MAYRGELQKIKDSDQKLVTELDASAHEEGKIKEKHYVQMQREVQDSIE